MPFNNAVVGGTNLVREAIKSPNFQAGVSGWIIRKDGTAEFASAIIRGTLIAGPTTGKHLSIDGTTGIHLYDSSGTTIVGTFWVAATDESFMDVQSVDTTTINMPAAVPGPAGLRAQLHSNLAGTPIQFFLPFTDGIQFLASAQNDPVPMFNGGSGLYRVPAGMLAIGRSTAGTVAGAGPTKDGGCGDKTFTVVAGRRYRITYNARAQVSAVPTSVVFQIRDGGAASPTGVSPIIAASQSTPSAAGGAGEEIFVSQFFDAGDLTAGTHTVAAFYQRSAGAGNVNPSQSLERQLIVYDEG